MHGVSSLFWAFLISTFIICPISILFLLRFTALYRLSMLLPIDSMTSRESYGNSRIHVEQFRSYPATFAVCAELFELLLFSHETRIVTIAVINTNFLICLIIRYSFPILDLTSKIVPNHLNISCIYFNSFISLLSLSYLRSGCEDFFIISYFILNHYI